MLAKYIFLFWFSCLAADPLFAPRQTKDYMTLTIPKSGSHLLDKALLMLSSNPGRGLIDIPEFRLDHFYFPPHSFATVERFKRLYPRRSPDALVFHFNFSNLAWEYAKENPDVVKLINIRDLRDVCVSTVSYLEAHFDRWMGPNRSFEDRLLYLINNGNHVKSTVFDVGREAKEALRWMKRPDVVVCRFEHLVGAQGGGSDALQQAELEKIARALGLSLSEEELRSIGSHLFGGTATFSKGTVQRWKQYFTPKVKKAFKKKLGAQLIEMGYESDQEW